MLSRIEVLDHGHAASFLDRLETHGTVAAGARQNDADGSLILVLCQGTEEVVDGQPGAALIRRLHQVKSAVQDVQIFTWRDDVDVVGVDLHPILHLRDRHVGMSASYLGEGALVIGAEMLHQDEGQTAVGGRVRQEGLKRC